MKEETALDKVYKKIRKCLCGQKPILDAGIMGWKIVCQNPDCKIGGVGGHRAYSSAIIAWNGKIRYLSE